MAKALASFTDPDGSTIDINVNHSFGPTVTIFCNQDGETCGVRLTPDQAMAVAMELMAATKAVLA